MKWKPSRKKFDSKFFVSDQKLMPKMALLWLWNYPKSLTRPLRINPLNACLVLRHSKEKQDLCYFSNRKNDVPLLFLQKIEFVEMKKIMVILQKKFALEHPLKRRLKTLITTPLTLCFCKYYIFFGST